MDRLDYTLEVIIRLGDRELAYIVEPFSIDDIYFNGDSKLNLSYSLRSGELVLLSNNRDLDGKRD